MTDFVVPEAYETGPDTNGCFTQVHYHHTKEGALIQTKEQYRKIILQSRTYEAAKKRRMLRKFGEAMRSDNSSHAVIGDETEIVFIKPVKQLTPEEEEELRLANVLPTLEDLLGEKQKVEEGPKKFKPRGWGTTDPNGPQEPDGNRAKVFQPRQRGISYVELPTKLFVSNIASYQEEWELERLFSQAGYVRNVFIPESHEDPTCNKGFGFVSYMDHDAAKNALELMNHARLNGMILDVRFAEERRV